MSLLALFDFGLQQSLEIAGPWTVELLRRHFEDHGQALPRALGRANDRAWQALSIALAGSGFVGQMQSLLASGDSRGIATQIRVFLSDPATSLPHTTADFRRQCLIELKQAKRAGVLSAKNFTAEQLLQRESPFAKYTETESLIDGANRALNDLAKGPTL